MLVITRFVLPLRFVKFSSVFILDSLGEKIMKQRLVKIFLMLTLALAYMLFIPQNLSAQDTDGDGVHNSPDDCPVTPNRERIACGSDRDLHQPELTEIYVMKADGTNQMR